MNVKEIKKNEDEKVQCVSCAARGVDTVAEFIVLFEGLPVELPLCKDCMDEMVLEEMYFGDNE